MLSKRFYDILTILFVLLSVSSMFYSNYLVSEVAKDAVNSGDLVNFLKMTEDDSRMKFSGYLDIFVKILVVIYWIFVLVLAIQMYKLGLVSMLDVIIVAILVPLSIVFYFLTLRGKYKKISKA